MQAKEKFSSTEHTPPFLQKPVELLNKSVVSLRQSVERTKTEHYIFTFKFCIISYISHRYIMLMKTLTPNS